MHAVCSENKSHVIVYNNINNYYDHMFAHVEDGGFRKKRTTQLAEVNTEYTLGDKNVYCQLMNML